MKHSDENKDFIRPKWLKQLQLHSWEPEILLSGIVLYGMFQTPGLLDQALAYAEVNIPMRNAFGFDTIVSMLKLAIDWLIFGLILHLICRGIWVGMIGLSFTFPNGIRLEELKLSPKFEAYFKKINSIEHVIIRLEKVCSSLFSISFMLFMCMIGGYLLLFTLIIIPIVLYVTLLLNGDFNLINETFTRIYAISMLVLVFIVLVDFLTLGYLKRLNWFSRIYYPLYRVVSVITLSFLYKHVYYSIISNFSRWTISLCLVFFVGVSFFLIGSTNSSVYSGDSFSSLEMWNTQSQVSVFSGYYDDQNQDKYSLRAHIQSDIVRSNTVRLFVVARADLEDSIRKVCNYDSLTNALDTAQMYINLHCVKSFFKVELDDTELQELTWKFHYKTSTQQRGILTWINIRQLPEGLHQLTVKGKDAGQFTYARIPFFREYANEFYLPEVPKEQAVDESYLKVKPILPK